LITAEFAEHVGDVIAFLTAVPVVVFIFMYVKYSPWKSTELGVALLIQKVAIGLILLQVFIRDFLPDDWSTGIYIIRLTLMTSLLVLFTIDVLNLRKYQKYGNDQQK
jgi:hypothetical protein